MLINMWEFLKNFSFFGCCHEFAFSRYPNPQRTLCLMTADGRWRQLIVEFLR